MNRPCRFRFLHAFTKAVGEGTNRILTKGQALMGSLFRFGRACGTMLTSRAWLLGVASIWISIVLVNSALPQSKAALPHLRRQGTATQLIVHDKPLLTLGGELGNSSASSEKYMAPIWPKLRAMKLNSILMPVYWEVIEPREGTFEFALVDHLLDSARANSLKIVVLWFGSWKNSMSCYAPAWVKLDTTRFERSRDSAGTRLEILSPFARASRITPSTSR